MATGIRIKNNNISAQIDNGQLMHYEFTDIEATLHAIHGEKYARYREEWRKASSQEYIPERPLYVVMSTNSYCNMDCKMCYRNWESSKEHPENIDLLMLQNVLRQCNSLGVPSFFVGADAECLINPYIKRILTDIKEIGGGIDNFLITNAYALSEDIINLLIDLQWERIYISLDAATQEAYQKIRGKDLSVVEKNLRNLLRVRNERKSVLPLIRVSFVIQNDNKNERDLFFNKWKDMVDVIDFQTCIDYSYVGKLKELPNIEYHCCNPYRELHINYDGEMHPCCNDFGYRMHLGNANDISVSDAWNSVTEQELRRQLKEGKLNNYCRNCAASMKMFD